MHAGEQQHGPRLRIGELAELAETTTRAIRYYHSIDLLDEPERDASGYRRYGPEHVIRLVRIRRLRALDMPLEQIAVHLSDEPERSGDLQTALRALAVDIGRQVAELEALRQRVLDLASSAKLVAPVETWQAALRAHGLLDESATVPEREHAAVDLLDALHPSGIEGVIAEQSALLSDPSFAERLDPLLTRFRSLPDDDETIEQLAVEAAALLPRPRDPAPAVDVETVDKLLGERFTAAQRRFLHRLRQLLEERDR